MCGANCAALCLYFDVLSDSEPARYEPGHGEGAFPPANDSVQERLGAQRHDTTQTREIYRLAAKKEKYNPSEGKRQANEARTNVNLGLAFSCFGALKGMKSDAELACFVMDR